MLREEAILEEEEETGDILNIRSSDDSDTGKIKHVSYNNTILLVSKYSRFLIF